MMGLIWCVAIWALVMATISIVRRWIRQRDK